MSTTKELKPKPVLFHISHSLFKNKRLKRRLAGAIRKKSSKKRIRNRIKTKNNGQRLCRIPTPSETIEISTDDESERQKPPQKEPPKPYELEASIVLSSDEEDEMTKRTRLFPMLSSETTVHTAIGNTVYELSLTQLKENLESIAQKSPVKKSNKNKNNGALDQKRLSDTVSAEVSISLLSDDEEDINHHPEAHALL